MEPQNTKSGQPTRDAGTTETRQTTKTPTRQTKERKGQAKGPTDRQPTTEDRHPGPHQPDKEEPKKRDREARAGKMPSQRGRKRRGS